MVKLAATDRGSSVEEIKLRQKKMSLGLAVAAAVLFIFGAILFFKGPSLGSGAAARDLLLSAQSEASLFDDFFSAQTHSYDEIGVGENLFSALNRLGLPSSDAEKFVAAFQNKVNLRLLRPGDV